jgi:hypothetical protein
MLCFQKEMDCKVSGSLETLKTFSAFFMKERTYSSFLMVGAWENMFFFASSTCRFHRKCLRTRRF